MVECALKVVVTGPVTDVTGKTIFIDTPEAQLENW
jgi:hypothetical protein